MKFLLYSYFFTRKTTMKTDKLTASSILWILFFTSNTFNETVGEKHTSQERNTITTIPNYNIDDELLSVGKNIDLKKTEVSQTFRKWEETIDESNLDVFLNNQTGKFEIEMKKIVKYLIPKIPKIPIPDPRDNHLEPYVTSETKYWTNFLLEQRKKFRENNGVFIESAKMREILRHVFEATDNDLDAFENARDNMNHDPYVSCRKMATYR
jgi:hypothetical protein